jgi:hypothetical protein
MLPAVVFIAVFSQQSRAGFPEYDNQNSHSTGKHSSICTYSEGICEGIWDFEFAGMVKDAMVPGGQKNYAETAFAFMECFGGGMIDELAPIVGTSSDVTSFTSASRYNEEAWHGNRDAASGGKRESYYNLYYAQKAGGATAYNQREASEYGYDNDLIGPKVNDLGGGETTEHPQYVYNCQLGSETTPYIKIPKNPPTLYRANADTLGNIPNKYLAIIFGGSENISANYNSVSRIYSNLKDRGYKDEEIYLMYPENTKPNGTPLPVTWHVDAGTTYDDMSNAWKWVKNRTDSDTQVYYWSSICHGCREESPFFPFELPVPPVVTIDYDLTDDFVKLVKDMFYFFDDIPDVIGGKPYFQVIAPDPVLGLSVVLNDKSLTFLDDTVHLAGADTYYMYKFALDQIDIGNLQTGNSIEFNWMLGEEPVDVYFTMAGIVTSSRNAIPEPATFLLFAIAGLLIRRK